MSIPFNKPQPETPPTKETEDVVVPDRMQIKVLAWRAEELEKAGWTPLRAAHIASLTMNDLIEMGYTEEAAAHAFPDFWRLARKAIECGDESLALYLIGLSSER